VQRTNVAVGTEAVVVLLWKDAADPTDEIVEQSLWIGTPAE
jgi:hypothetical protein